MQKLKPHPQNIDRWHVRKTDREQNNDGSIKKMPTGAICFYNLSPRYMKQRTRTHKGIPLINLQTGKRIIFLLPSDRREYYRIKHPHA